MEILYNYGQLFGAGSRGSFPSIVLIDGENKVQNFLQGTKTANEILSEIKKFADIDAEGDPFTGNEAVQRRSRLSTSYIAKH